MQCSLHPKLDEEETVLSLQLLLFSHVHAGAYDYFLFFLYLFGSWTLEFRLYFRLFFISSLSLCSSRPLLKLLYKHFAFGTRFFSHASEMLAKNGVLPLPFQYVFRQARLRFSEGISKHEKGGLRVCSHNS